MSRTTTNEARPSWGCSADLAPSDMVRKRRAQIWFGVWVVALLATVFGLKRWEPEPSLLAYVIAATPATIMAIAFLSYANFLRKADELTRKIQSEGLAVGMGAGLFVSLSYPVFERVGAPTLDPAAGVIVMVAAFSVTVSYLQHQYRK